LSGRRFSHSPTDNECGVSVTKFQDSQKAGCIGCGVILDAIEAFKPYWKRKSVESDGLWINLTLRDMVLSVIVGSFSGMRWEYTPNFEVFKRLGRTLNLYFLYENPSGLLFFIILD
jgi:hypothetical protein